MNRMVATKKTSQESIRDIHLFPRAKATRLQNAWPVDLTLTPLRLQ